MKYNLNDTFTFGKYRGRKVKDIISTHYSYIRWCIDNVSNFELSEECQLFKKEIDLKFKSEKYKRKTMYTGSRERVKKKGRSGKYYEGEDHPLGNVGMDVWGGK